MPHLFKKELIISFSVIGGSILIFGVVLYFLSQNLVLEADKVAADRLFVSQRAAAITALASLKTDALKSDIYLQAMNKILVPQDQLLYFSRWLDELARVRQIGLSYSPGERETPPQGDSPGFIGFSLNLTGGLQNLLDFLKDVESRSPRFLTVIYNSAFTRSDAGYSVFAEGKVFFK